MEVLLSYSRHHNVCPQFEMTHQKHLDSLESYHMLLYDCGFLHIRCLRDANELALHRWPYSTIGELPAHSHTGTTNSNGNHTHTVTMNRTNKKGNETDTVWSYSENLCGSGSVTTSTNGSHTHSFTTNTTGSNTSHNNMQPYITVYRWKRTG